ncbi:MAG: hypothetical protein JJE04_17380 [Acidobacteriia bacterium]|nr:hypothetical protein [Terriglobia bacterium]
MSRCLWTLPNPTLGRSGGTPRSWSRLSSRGSSTASASLMFTRSIFNPGRSFANVMSLKNPWHRHTRPGLNELAGKQ